MEAWKARLQVSWRLFLGDEKEDHLNLNLILELGFNTEEVLLPRIARGSHPKKAANIERYRHQMHGQMMEDYLCDALVYGLFLFCQCYRMQCSLFLSILERACAWNNYFVLKRDTTRSLGLFLYKKIIVVLRMPCSGMCADTIDEYCWTSERTAIMSLKRFCVAI
jgi:hypothetical protein